MKKKLGVLGITSALLLAINGTVFANVQPEVVNQKVEENKYLHFTPVSEESLSEEELAFVNKSKMEQGVHQKGTLYVISLGEKPNPGYQLEFVKSETTWEQERIYVKQILPKEGFMYPQVIHYPYIAGRLQLPTKYMTVSVIDIDTGKPLFIEQTNQPIDTKVIKIFINGEIYQFDQPPIVKGNRTLVPLRGIFEALGAEVQYDQATGKITVTKENVKIILKINSKSVTKNGKTEIIDEPAILTNNRTLVPLRFIGEALGADVKWDPKQNAVFITTEK